MLATWMTPITLSFQRHAMESRNFIKLVNIKVMLKYDVLMIMKSLDPSVEHWDDKKRRHLHDSTFASIFAN
ncbi:MAG: hypothetical protein ACR5KX_02615 [Wolbachia sp.]